MVNYLLKKYATGQATAECDAAILRDMQPAIVFLQQCADDLVASSCTVSEIYDEGILNVVIIKGTNT